MMNVCYAHFDRTKASDHLPVGCEQSLPIDSPTIPFIARWSPGDLYAFRVTKTKRQWREDEVTMDNASSYLVHFEIMDSTATRYTIRWSFDYDFSQLPLDQRFYDMFAKYQTTEVIYTTTELGEFVGIENWQEISDNMKGITSLVLDIVSEEDPSMAASYQAALNPLLEVYNTKEGIEQTIFEELFFFHFPFGYEYDVSETLEYQDFLPNMFGGKPIRGDVQLYFDEVDYESATCKIIQEMQINPGDAKNAISSVIASMGLSDEEFDEAMRSAQFDITDYNQYEYNYDPGVPIKIETRREILMNLDNEEGRRVEETIIELVDLPVFTESEIFDAPEVKTCFTNTEVDCDQLPATLRDDCCLSSMMAYLSQVEYPNQAKDRGIEGKVLLRFVVEKDGKVTQIEKIRGDDILAASAIKHIQNSSGLWIPGKNNGEIVRTRFVAPFTFQLPKNENSR